jgi:integrase
MPQRTTWEIYEIQHSRGPGYPVRARYQFVDGHGKRRHFATKVRAKLERDKAKALFTQEGKLAAGMDEQHRRDAVQAVKLLPTGWTLTRCVQFVADHIKRTTQVLSIAEAIDRFLVTKEKASQYHSNDLSRRLKRWAETWDQTQPIHSVTKQELETYLSQYSTQNFINHRAALSNLFGYAFKVGAAPENPLSTIEKPRIKRARPAILSDTEFATLLSRARSHDRFDALAWLVLGGLVGLRPYEVLRLEWAGIHFQTREIRIEPGWTKTHRARVIPLQANALEWLRLIAAHTKEKTGRVMPSESTWNNRWQRWRQEEDAPLPLAWWVGKDDILRHSYGTYRAAMLRNSHNLAEEMGNSVTMVRTYYDAVVSPSVAKLWWKIRPAEPRNVVPTKPPRSTRARVLATTESIT